MSNVAKENLNFQLPTTDEKPEYVQKLFQKVARYYDLMNDCMTFGLHRLWKKKACQLLCLPIQGKVLDVACGTGDLAFYLNKQYPNAELVGLDFCEDMLVIARKRAQDKQLNAQFIQGDGLNLPFENNQFNGAVISYGLRNMADYKRCLSEMVRVIEPGSRVVILDMSHPNKLMGVLSAFYRFQVMPLLGKFIANDTESYKYLSNSIYFYLNQVELVGLMQDSGLTNVQYENLMGGVCALHWGLKA